MAPEPGPVVLERIARLESIWGDHRVVMCSFTAGRNGWLKGGHIGTASQVLYWRSGKWFGNPVGIIVS